MQTLKVFEAFAGYGSQTLALKRLKQHHPEFSFENVGISEIDKHAVKAYQTLHGDVMNYGDISKIEWENVPDFDLFTYSFPCQAISAVGLQKGFTEGSGTTSSLLWECKRAIMEKKPKFLVMENVKNLVSKKFMPHFQKWIDWLSENGYRSFWQVLNAKDFGVPQSRERVFMVSIRYDVDYPEYTFPEKQKLDKRLKDIIEEYVDASYYLSQQQIDNIEAHCRRKIEEGCGFRVQLRTIEDICPTISTKYGQRQTDPLLAKVMCVASTHPEASWGKQPRNQDRVYSPAGISPCLDTMRGGDRTPKIIYTESMGNCTVRKLTNRECYRLQGVDDEDIDKLLSSGISKTQHYKLAGNSICVAPLFGVFEKLLID
jgi:DNA (cytosine-5)-methyltransferase 1